jgi:hypothetical protein
MFDITDLARVQERSVRYGRGRRGEDASGEVVKPRWGQVFFVVGESCTAAPLRLIIPCVWDSADDHRVACVGSDTGYLVITRIELSAII